MKTQRSESRRTGSNVGRKPAKNAADQKTARRRLAPHDRNKSAKILALLRRAAGATMNDLINATTWKPHSVRGFLSGVVRTKLGLKLVALERKNGERAYKISPR